MRRPTEKAAKKRKKSNKHENIPVRRLFGAVCRDLLFAANFKLMVEKSHAGERHCNAEFVADFYNVVVAYGAAGFGNV